MLYPTLTLLGFTILFIICAYIGVPLWAWTLSAIALLSSTLLFNIHLPIGLWMTVGMIATVLNIPILRRTVITQPIFHLIRSLKVLPKISDTEAEAIASGTVWVDGEYFSGTPDLKRMMAEDYPIVSTETTPELQAFLDGPVDTVCAMTTDWDIYQRKDLPSAVWDYLKQEKFFGLMIPKEYGGLGFNHLAYSAVMVKLASRSFSYVATVGVANSLGPAKLLLKYGTEDQKTHYLPRLASGDEIPCFALTEPTAGSDAASITSSGEVFRDEDGELYLRLNWKKRYITLGAIATLLGLAFRLRDPHNILGNGEDVGITCALVATDTPGVILNQRHDPMGVPFFNSPTEGHNVVIPIGNIIGGIEQAGQGWRMLMQSLAAGRGISFPATCTGMAELVSRVASAHAVIRQQFGLSIGKFEGIEEPLARIGAMTYMVDAARLYTCGAVDNGHQPAVVSAIAKYTTTELARQIVNDGMDILGGSGICRGPRNLLANMYTATPISITVEGANILTRTVMIFGQGAIRCHPYVYDEIQALQSGNIANFDRAIWSHLGALVRNGVRAKLYFLSRGRLISIPPQVSLSTSPQPSPSQGEGAGGSVSPLTKGGLRGGMQDFAPQTEMDVHHRLTQGERREVDRYYQKLTWASTTFALLTDLALFCYGGNLKRREKITGRFADILSWLYLATATLRRFKADGDHVEDFPLVQWSLHYALAQIQEGFEGVFKNWDTPIIGHLLRGWVYGWFRINPIGTLPSDELGHQVAVALQKEGGVRDRLTAHIYNPDPYNPDTYTPDPYTPDKMDESSDDALSRLNRTFILAHQAEPILKKIKMASRSGRLPKGRPNTLVSEAFSAGVISENELKTVSAASIARYEAIQVDAFTLEDYMTIGAS